MKRLGLLLACWLTVVVAAAQTAPPFYKDILQFKHRDSVQPPAKNPILFIGSSSFTKWKDIQDYFPGYPIVNNGFGGSTLPDLIRYFYEITAPYQPKQVVIFCGENDIASSDTIRPSTVALRLKTLFGMLRTNYPNANIIYISTKPSPVRARMQDRMKETNRLIRTFITQQKNARFINVYDAMLDKNGNMREELFVSDRLHMKPEGYHIWQGLLQPYLMR